jgi:hypothetical protein
LLVLLVLEVVVLVLVLLVLSLLLRELDDEVGILSSIDTQDSLNESNIRK